MHSDARDNAAGPLSVGYSVDRTLCRLCEIPVTVGEGRRMWTTWGKSQAVVPERISLAQAGLGDAYPQSPVLTGTTGISVLLEDKMKKEEKMKFTCSRDDILKEISVAQEVISSKNSLSVLSNVLLTVAKGELKLQATDLKVGFETSLPVEIVAGGNNDRLLRQAAEHPALPSGRRSGAGAGRSHDAAHPAPLEKGRLPASLHPLRQVSRAGARLGQHVLRLSAEGLHRDGVQDPLCRLGRRDALLHERDLPGKAG